MSPPFAQDFSRSSPPVLLPGKKNDSPPVRSLYRALIYRTIASQSIPSSPATGPPPLFLLTSRPFPSVRLMALYDAAILSPVKILFSAASVG